MEWLGLLFDGNTDIERTIIVTHNASFTAVFHDPFVGIDTLSAPEITLLTQGRDIIVQGAEGRNVSLFDIMGRRIASAVKATASETLRTPAAGVYLLHIEGLPARKIVVR